MRGRKRKSDEIEEYRSEEASKDRLDYVITRENRVVNKKQRAEARPKPIPEALTELPERPTQQGRYCAAINKPLKQIASSITDRCICKICGGEAAVEILRVSKDGINFVKQKRTRCLRLAKKFGTEPTQCEIQIEVIE